jgi:hypothetical protein
VPVVDDPARGLVSDAGHIEPIGDALAAQADIDRSHDEILTQLAEALLGTRGFGDC